MSALLLSRTLDPADYTHFGEELTVVDSHSLAGQHPHRRWEYALALHAIWRWRACEGRPRAGSPVYDIGGAGTPFHHMLGTWTEREVVVIDPAHPDSNTVEAWATGGSQLADVLTCISVVEHVERVDPFLYAMSCLLAPGGLLVLTMDFWNQCGPDLAENRDLRRRIYCPKTYQQLRVLAQTLNLETFGGVDPRYHGPHVHDYTFASLVLQKRP